MHEMTDIDLDLATTEYYRIHCRLSKYGEPEKLIARVRVYRRDTNEATKEWFSVTGEDEILVLSEAKQRIESELIPRLEKIGAPEEWNTRIRHILVQVDQVNRLIGGSKVTLDHDNCELGTNFGSSEEYVDLWTTLIRESVSISAQIEKLSPEERIALLKSPDWVFDDPSDNWSLVDLDARNRAFSFFSEPSAAESKAHESQLKRLEARHKELAS